MSGGAVFASPVIPGERVERPMQLVFPCSILQTCIGSIRDARHAGAVQASAAEHSTVGERHGRVGALRRQRSL